MTQAKFQLFHGDAMKFLAMAPNQSVDCIITDPPYESLEKHRKVGTTTRLTKQWFQVVPNDFFPEFFAECYRVLKKDSHCYVFVDQETMFAIKPMGEAAGFKFWKPIVWDKVHIGMGYHYRARYEFILFFEKGKRKLNDLGQPDIITAARISSQGRNWPTEKPPGVANVLIRQSTNEGELVVDPFMGSGSTGAAALMNGRNFAGCDLEAEAVEIARKRLETRWNLPREGLDQ